MPQKITPNKKHLAHAEVVKRQSQMIRYISIAVIAIVLLLVVYGILNDTLFKQIRPVATINGEKITASEFQNRVKLQRGQLINQFSQYYQFAQMFGSQDPLNDPNFGQTLQSLAKQLSDPQTVGQQVLDLMIAEKLIRQEADKRGITISPEEVETLMQQQFSYFPSGTPTTEPTATPFATLAPPTLSPAQLTLVTITPTPSPLPAQPSPTASNTPEFTATPTTAPTATPSPTQGPTETPLPSATPYTLQGYQTRVAESMSGLVTSTGLKENDFRVLLENSLLRDKLQAEIVKDLQPADEYIWAQHILVGSEADAKAVLERLKNGEDWTKLAAELSQDPSNANNGGDLGYFGHGVMVPDFEKAAFALTDIGQISEPVQTSFGWHIIRLLGREQRPLTADQFTQLKQRTFQTWLDDLRANSKVTVNETFWKEIVPSEPVLPGLQ